MGWFRSKATDGGDRRSLTIEERVAAIVPGSPGRCPACDGLGFIDHLDIGRRYQIQHCKDCGHRWEYLFDPDGQVVGLTELDEDGHPVARTRVRPRPLVAERAPEPEPHVDVPPEAPPAEIEADAQDEAGAPTVEAPAEVPLVIDPPAEEPEEDDHVIDLRTPAPTAEVDEPVDAPGGDADAEEDVDPPPANMSPAEWLRHAVGR